MVRPTPATPCPPGSSGLTFTGGTLTAGATTGGDGVATFTVCGTDSQAAATFAVASGVSSPANVSVVPGLAASVAVTGSSATPVAGSSHDLTLTVSDSHGNVALLTGVQSVTVSGQAAAPLGAGGGQSGVALGTGAQAVSVDFKSGVGTAPLVLDDAATRQLTLAVDGLVTLPTTVTPAAASPTGVGGPGTAVAGQWANAIITFTDACQNTNANRTLTVGTGNGDVNLTGLGSSPNCTAPTYPSSLAVSNGTLTAAITPDLADGTETLAAQCETGGPVVTAGTAITVAAAAPAAITGVIDPSRAVAGATITF